jgi:hypothetical protein
MCGLLSATHTRGATLRRPNVVMTLVSSIGCNFSMSVPCGVNKGRVRVTIGAIMLAREIHRQLSA